MKIQYRDPYPTHGLDMSPALISKIERLKNSLIEVEVGICEGACRDQLTYAHNTGFRNALVRCLELLTEKEEEFTDGE